MRFLKSRLLLNQYALGKRFLNSMFLDKVDTFYILKSIHFVFIVMGFYSMDGFHPNHGQYGLRYSQKSHRHVGTPNRRRLRRQSHARLFHRVRDSCRSLEGQQAGQICYGPQILHVIHWKTRSLCRQIQSGSGC